MIMTASRTVLPACVALAALLGDRPAGPAAAAPAAPAVAAPAIGAPGQGGPGPATAGRLSEMDVFNIEYAVDPQVSPDGRRVVFVRRSADIFTDRWTSNLWVVNLDGSDPRPLTTGRRNDSSPRWSPDGGRIAYLSSEGEEIPQIYVRWMDGGQTARITNLASPPAGPAWSPDGRTIAFTGFVPREAPKIAALPPAPEGATWAPPPVVIDRLIYRFNGEGYLKPGFTHLFVVPAEGGTPRQISSGDFQHGGGAYDASDPVWTPDGKSLLLSANRHPDWELEPYDTEVYEFALADGAVKALTRRKGPDQAPVVSPDGRRIAYVGYDDRYQGYQVTRLYVMNRDGSGARLLTADLDRDVENPRWAADGSGIVFAYDDRGNTRIGFQPLEGKLRTVARDLGSRGSAYSGGSFSVGRNGSFAYTWSRPDRPSDIATGTLAGSSTRVITDLNSDALSGKRLGAVEEITFPSSLDKRPIQGWLVKPPGFEPGKKYPLILEIHGGPFANYGDRFDLEKQIWAAKGYVVLYVNPRGSTSYGEEFGNLIHHAYPGDDFHDLEAGVDAAIARGFVDPGNLFVTGGSGGGVLTCWMIGRSDRFRAAASAYPVINWYSFALTSDIPVLLTKYWFPGLPWDHAEEYEKRSLLSVVKNVKTPTLVITGEEDYRTPMSESEQYYTALKLLGVEAVLVRVPGEPHGIRARPSHWMAKILDIVGWFDRHKKEAA
jgi:dipeptidyl aminopeptidase/acylaminoacyl peptidase